MKKWIFTLAFALTALGLFAQKSQPVELKTALDSANYANGVVLAGNIKRQMGEDFNKDIFLAALTAALNEEKVKMDNDQASRVYSEYSRKAQAKVNERHKAENLKFLEENKKRTGVTTTASGLQYEVMKKGEGTVSPKATDEVEVHYHGYTIDNNVFDSSVQRNQTAKFPLNRVIPGWTEGLQYMKIGDKFKFFIPSSLAYGERGSPPKIKGNSTLIFEVELFNVTAK